MRPTDLPEGLWIELAIDLLDILDGDKLLVIADYFSRWPEIINLKKADTAHVIRALEAVFRTHGLPMSLGSDNGPPFSPRHPTEKWNSLLATEQW
jgi:hypothetical protein